MTEKIIPDGYKLVAVKGLDELVYWLERCKDKGHLENCADLIEPFEAFEYRNVSEEAVIAAHEAKAAPAVPFGYFRVDALGWTDCAETDEGAIALYERPAAPAVPQGEPVAWQARFLGQEWAPCTKEHHDWVRREPKEFVGYEVRALCLCAAPAAPSQEPVTLTDEQKRDIASNWFSEDWAIKQAMGLMDDYESAIAAMREKEGK